MYYLQSRYYNPTVGRFINADAYAATGHGLLGDNMFAYCNNNPTSRLDSTGFSWKKCFSVMDNEESEEPRDVTDEIMEQLDKAADRAKQLNMLSRISILFELVIYSEFYKLVNHEAPWDIKRADSWEKTIGTSFPGYDVGVLFVGVIMTPENIGNFTYGYLGQAYGIPLPILLGGSFYAAGFPREQALLENEFFDWGFIYMGYTYAKSSKWRSG